MLGDPCFQASINQVSYRHSYLGKEVLSSQMEQVSGSNPSATSSFFADFTQNRANQKVMSHHRV